MYEQLNESLSQSRENIFRLQKIDAGLKTLQSELNVLREKERRARAVLEKENRDYEKITQVSLSSIFFNTLGKLEDRTEKERREALEAELQYNQALKDLEDVQSQIRKLESERGQFANAGQVYDELYKQKLQVLMSESGGSAHRIMELNARMGQSRNNMREIDEAMNVGNEVAACLSEAMEHLNSAEGWGVWDMLGGGFISDMVKHSHIDDAGYEMRRVQELLRRFRTELADISISADINVEIGGFAKFADFFFDGLIADWFMQSKINASQENLNNTWRQVDSVMKKLNELREDEARLQEGLRAELDAVVINGGGQTQWSN